MAGAVLLLAPWFSFGAFEWMDSLAASIATFGGPYSCTYMSITKSGPPVSVRLWFPPMVVPVLAAVFVASDQTHFRDSERTGWMLPVQLPGLCGNLVLGPLRPRALSALEYGLRSRFVASLGPGEQVTIAGVGADETP